MNVPCSGCRKGRLLFTIISIVSTLILGTLGKWFQVESKTSHLISMELQFVVEVL
jgi:hypothetical protein